jgi:hypothetical protein
VSRISFDESKVGRKDKTHNMLGRITLTTVTAECLSKMKRISVASERKKEERY